MNIRHLGDAHDHWKGSLIGMLEPVLREIHVLPMFTDDSPEAVWTDERLNLYARLLRVPATRVLHRQLRFTHQTRADYFQKAEELNPRFDLFADPDTGIATGRKGSPKHVALQEMARLLPPSSSRLLLVYQHSSRATDYIKDCLKKLSSAAALRGCHFFAYWAGNVSMVFASRDKSRVSEVRHYLYTAFPPLPNGHARVTGLYPVRPSRP